jgi:hypothetical protein
MCLNCIKEVPTLYLGQEIGYPQKTSKGKSGRRKCTNENAEGMKEEKKQ